MFRKISGRGRSSGKSKKKLEIGDALRELFEVLKLPPGCESSVDAASRSGVHQAISNVFDSLDSYGVGSLVRSELDELVRKYLVLCRHLCQLQNRVYSESCEEEADDCRVWLIADMCLSEDPTPYIDKMLAKWSTASGSGAAAASHSSAVTSKVFSALGGKNGRILKDDFMRRVPDVLFGDFNILFGEIRRMKAAAVGLGGSRLGALGVMGYGETGGGSALSLSVSGGSGRGSPRYSGSHSGSAMMHKSASPKRERATSPRGLSPRSGRPAHAQFDSYGRGLPPGAHRASSPRRAHSPHSPRSPRGFGQSSVVEYGSVDTYRYHGGGDGSMSASGSHTPTDHMEVAVTRHSSSQRKLRPDSIGIEFKPPPPSGPIPTDILKRHSSRHLAGYSPVPVIRGSKKRSISRSRSAQSKSKSSISISRSIDEQREVAHGYKLTRDSYFEDHEYKFEGYGLFLGAKQIGLGFTLPMEALSAEQRGMAQTVAMGLAPMIMEHMRHGTAHTNVTRVEYCGQRSQESRGSQSQSHSWSAGAALGAGYMSSEVGEEEELDFGDFGYGDEEEEDLDEVDEMREGTMRSVHVADLADSGLKDDKGHSKKISMGAKMAIKFGIGINLSSDDSQDSGYDDSSDDSSGSDMVTLLSPIGDTPGRGLSFEDRISEAIRISKVDALLMHAAAASESRGNHHSGDAPDLDDAEEVAGMDAIEAELMKEDGVSGDGGGGLPLAEDRSPETVLSTSSPTPEPIPFPFVVDPTTDGESDEENVTAIVKEDVSGEHVKEEKEDEDVSASVKKKKTTTKGRPTKGGSKKKKTKKGKGKKKKRRDSDSTSESVDSSSEDDSDSSSSLNLLKKASMSATKGGPLDGGSDTDSSEHSSTDCSSSVSSDSDTLSEYSGSDSEDRRKHKRRAKRQKKRRRKRRTRRRNQLKRRRRRARRKKLEKERKKKAKARSKARAFEQALVAEMEMTQPSIVDQFVNGEVSGFEHSDDSSSALSFSTSAVVTDSDFDDILLGGGSRKAEEQRSGGGARHTYQDSFAVAFRIWEKMQGVAFTDTMTAAIAKEAASQVSYFAQAKGVTDLKIGADDVRWMAGSGPTPGGPTPGGKHKKKKSRKKSKGKGKRKRKKKKSKKSSKKVSKSKRKLVEESDSSSFGSSIFSESDERKIDELLGDDKVEGGHESSDEMIPQLASSSGVAVAAMDASAKSADSGTGHLATQSAVEKQFEKLMGGESMEISREMWNLADEEHGVHIQGRGKRKRVSKKPGKMSSDPSSKAVFDIFQEEAMRSSRLLAAESDDRDIQRRIDAMIEPESEEDLDKMGTFSMTFPRVALETEDSERDAFAKHPRVESTASEGMSFGGSVTGDGTQVFAGETLVMKDTGKMLKDRKQKKKAECPKKRGSLKKSATATDASARGRRQGLAHDEMESMMDYIGGSERGLAEEKRRASTGSAAQRGRGVLKRTKQVGGARKGGLGLIESDTSEAAFKDVDNIDLNDLANAPSDFQKLMTTPLGGDGSLRRHTMPPGSGRLLPEDEDSAAKKKKKKKKTAKKKKKSKKKKSKKKKSRRRRREDSSTDDSHSDYYSSSTESSSDGRHKKRKKSKKKKKKLKKKTVAKRSSMTPQPTDGGKQKTESSASAAHRELPSHGFIADMEHRALESTVDMDSTWVARSVVKEVGDVIKAEPEGIVRAKLDGTRFFAVPPKRKGGGGATQGSSHQSTKTSASAMREIERVKKQYADEMAMQSPTHAATPRQKRFAKCGRLVVKIVGAMNLGGPSSSGSSPCAYCVVTVKTVDARTRPVKGASPSWKQILIFNNYRPKKQKKGKPPREAMVCVMNKKKVRKDTTVGYGTFKLPAKFGELERFVVQLINRKGQPKGVVVVDTFVQKYVFPEEDFD